jgi:TonB-dependent SusC/RagA subfamily outer membrane receptor
MKRWLVQRAALGVLAVPGALEAQDARSFVQVHLTGERSPARRRASMLLAPARLDVGDVRIAVALEQLMRSAGVRIAYSESLLPRDRTVSCRCASVSVAGALDSLLGALPYRWAEGKGQIVLEPTSEPTSEAAATRAADARRAGTISGTVTDALTRRPVAAAQVALASGGLGAVTADDGTYTIRAVPAGPATLRVRRIGFAPVDRPVTVVDGQTATVDFALAEQTRTLSEVVVTGTAGATTRREVGNSIASVNMSKLADQPTPEVQDIIGARVAGATIMRNEGAAGAGGSIRIRGINSLTQGNRPLIYVDGVRLYSSALPESSQGQSSSPLNDIDPNDIERIEIIKGAAATTLYGTEASNGVVQVFTKRGGAGQKPTWEAKVTGGVSSLGQIGPDESPAFIQKYGEKARGLFMDQWVRDAVSQEYNLSVRASTGGPNGVNYFLSTGYGDEQGVLPKQGAKTTNLRGNLGFRPAKSLLVQFNNAYTGRDIRWIPGGWAANSFTLNVMRGPFDYTQDRDSVFLTEFLTEENQNHFVSGVDVAFTPTENLSAKAVVGLDYIDSDYRNTVGFGSLLVPQGSRTERRFRNVNRQVDLQATYNRRALSWLTTATSAGVQMFEAQALTVTGTSSRFAGPGNPTLNTGSQQNASEARLRVVNAGYFFQELLGISERLFVTAGVRLDGNSAFGRDFGLQTYPKISASYVLSDYGFWPRMVEEAKVRLAYGVSGKAPGYFDALRTWVPISANEGSPGVSPTTRGNPNIGPERSGELEGGFELGAYNGRLTADVSVYRQRTTDALLSVPQDPSLGFIDPQILNVGTIKNNGYEVALRGIPIRRGDFSWELGLTASGNRSNMADLGGGPSVFVGADLAPGLWVKEGYAVPGYWGPKLLNPDEVGAPKTAESYYGPVFPTRLMSFSTTVNVRKGLSFSALSEFQGGNYNMSHTAWRNAQRRVWPPCYAVVQKIEAEGRASLTARERYECDPSSTSYGAYISKADFWRVRSIAMSYDLPARLTGGRSRWNLGVAARNLFTSTDYIGIDPEVTQGGDTFTRWEYYQTPIPRTFSLTVRTTF